MCSCINAEESWWLASLTDPDYKHRNLRLCRKRPFHFLSVAPSISTDVNCSPNPVATHQCVQEPHPGCGKRTRHTRFSSHDSWSNWPWLKPAVAHLLLAVPPSAPMCPSLFSRRKKKNTKTCAGFWTHTVWHNSHCLHENINSRIYGFFHEDTSLVLQIFIVILCHQH